jgi:putative DNA primase/helicase
VQSYTNRALADDTPFSASASTVPTIVVENIPRELRDRDQWMPHRLEPGKNGRVEKVPYRTDGTLASSTDPATWCSFAEVINALDGGRFSGPSFAVTEDDPFTGIDLDHAGCEATGHVEPWARAIVDRLNSYTEWTPSGEGLRVWVRGVLPPEDRQHRDV